MSTRCNILIGNNQFYHHWDGYPQGVGADLAYFTANVNAGYLGAWGKNLDEIARYVSMKRGIIGRLANTNGGTDNGYEPENPGLHGDIEFLYLMTGTEGKYRLYAVNVWDYIGKHPSRKGEGWEHPFFGYDTHKLQSLFLKPEYEVPLPSPDVPTKDRLYFPQGIINHEEAVYLGLKTDLKYGEIDYKHGIVRVRNAKACGCSHDYPTCPYCGGQTSAEDLKSNGVEQGCYYECFRCPNCPEWFTVTYDTPDDSGKWTVDSPNRRLTRGFRGIFRRKGR